MKKRIALLLLLMMTAVLFTGCFDPWFKAEITSVADEYNPAGSEFPGMPLKIVFDVDGPMPKISNVTFMTDNGSFVSLESGSEVVNLGKSIEAGRGTVYWSPYEEGGMASDAKVTAVVTYIDKIVEVGRTFTVRIRSDGNGVYTLR